MEQAVQPTNQTLFQFDKSGYLPEPIFRLLIETQWPWEVMGTALTKAVEESVSKIPLKNRIKGEVSPAAILENSAMIVIEEGAIVEPLSYIIGPCYISRGAVVRHGAYVRGNCYAGPDAVIGHTTEIKDSILLAHAKAAHFAYVGNSILGNNCNLGAGTKLANFRFDGKNIRISLNGHKIDTGHRKFGAILGDGAQTGCNSVTNPGTILRPGFFLGPNKTALGIL